MAIESEKTAWAQGSQSSPEEFSSPETFDKDLAAAIVSERAQDFDTVIERRVLRKIDLYLIPWMWIGYGFVYYDKVFSDLPIYGTSLALRLTQKGNPGQCRSIRHDKGSFPQRTESCDQSPYQGYNPVKLGNIDLLLWDADWSLPNDLHTAALPNWESPWDTGNSLGNGCHAHGRCHFLAWSIRSALLPRLHRERHAHCIHVYR